MKSIHALLFLAMSLPACRHTAKTESDSSKSMASSHESRSAQMKEMMMSPEMHEKMANMHTEVADCLKTSENKELCLKVMKEHHEKMCSNMGGEKCMMMGRMLSPDDNGEDEN